MTIELKDMLARCSARWGLNLGGVDKLVCRVREMGFSVVRMRHTVAGIPTSAGASNWCTIFWGGTYPVGLPVLLQGWESRANDKFA